jgi:hypothetical protein
LGVKVGRVQQEDRGDDLEDLDFRIPIPDKVRKREVQEGRCGLAQIFAFPISMGGSRREGFGEQREV